MLAGAGTIRQSWISVYHETLYQKQLSSLWPHTLYGEVVSTGLKPVSMSVVSWRRADVVECLGLKLC